MRTATKRLAAVTSLIVVFLVAPLHRGVSSNIFIDQTGLRVLFIGNSLTYANDLPAIVDAFARSSTQGPFNYESIAYPNFSLEDHWNKGDARKAIIESRWDFVVLQQGPSASKEGRAVLLDYTRRYSELIRRQGAKTAMYSVWPSMARRQDFKEVFESYKLAAEAVDGIVFPVGEAWLSVWGRNASIALYDTDGFHPSEAASYLAGLVIFGQLYDRSPVGLPSKVRLHTGKTIEIPAGQAALLQESAERANKSLRRR